MSKVGCASGCGTRISKIDEKEKTIENSEDSSSDYFQDFDIVGLTPEVVVISPKPGERVIRRDCFFVN